MHNNIAKPLHQMTAEEFELAFQDEEACQSYLANRRWPEAVACPRCGHAATEHGTMKWHWNCYKCTRGGLSYRFSVKVGTLFEGSNKPLRQWFRVMHMILTCHHGISARQVHRTMGFGSYATALNMCRKIRAALSDKEFRLFLGGIEGDSLAAARDSQARFPANGHRARPASYAVAGNIALLPIWSHFPVQV